jgi:chemotaxis protein methyltransferase CheR
LRASVAELMAASRSGASPQVMALLSAFIEDRTGIHYGADDFPLLYDKVSSRANELGFDSLLDYYYLLRYDDPSSREFDALVDVLVVPETYFFREFDAIKLVVADFLTPLVNAGKRPRVWCAACATGEEPLTLAMLLADKGLLGQVEIVASDLSPRNLARAREGRFGTRALRQLPDRDLASRYVDTTGGKVSVLPELMSAVDWRRVNLVERPQVSELGLMHVILCRNVLIYFQQETAVRVVGNLQSVLLPDGALFVGVSESLLRFGTALVCEERAGTFFYRKPV